MKRFVLIVLDSVGVGALPDAENYGDKGSHTLGHTAEAVGGLRLPHLAALGLGRITPIRGVPEVADPTGAWGRMAELSVGKDTTTGHWEIAGLPQDRPFPTYPEGFPDEVMEGLSRITGRGFLGNYPASGTEIIARLGCEHEASGKPIVYTSADSVFQIACHEEVVPLPQLYEWCGRLRDEVLVGEHAVARVIARPFLDQNASYVRTKNRKDYSLPPTEPTMLDRLSDAGVLVVGVGKVHDIFAGRGIARSVAAKTNDETIDGVLETLRNTEESCLVFANCIDFDMLWGHRRDPRGYAEALEAFDRRVPCLLNSLSAEDVLCILADHGCDPTHHGTDHTREYVPLLLAGMHLRPTALGTRTTFADAGQSICDFFGAEETRAGTSFMPELWRDGLEGL